MMETLPNSEEMKRYLFREMTEQESDSIEERIFDDSEFYYEMTALENDLVDRYVCGKLAGTDLERFERSLKILPQRREKVATAIALQSVIAEERVNIPPTVEQSFWEKIAQRFNFTLSGMKLAAGFLTILIICVGAFLIYKNRQARNDFAEAERIEKEKQRQLEEQQRLIEEKQRRLDDLTNRPLENNNNGLNENKNTNNEIEKLKKDIEDLRRKNDVPKRNPNELKSLSPYLAVAIARTGRGGDGVDPSAGLEIVDGKQLVKITKPLPEEKEYTSYVVVANGRIVEGKNISAGAKSIVFYLPPEIENFEIQAAERTTRGEMESLGAFKLTLTKNK